MEEERKGKWELAPTPRFTIASPPPPLPRVVRRPSRRKQRAALAVSSFFSRFFFWEPLRTAPLGLRTNPFFFISPPAQFNFNSLQLVSWIRSVCALDFNFPCRLYIYVCAARVSLESTCYTFRIIQACDTDVNSEIHSQHHRQRSEIETRNFSFSHNIRKSTNSDPRIEKPEKRKRGSKARKHADEFPSLPSQILK